MVRSGTLCICVQNLDFSGANQVILNIVAGSVHQGNVVILSPRLGPLVSRFVDSGASVRVGEILQLLGDIRDVFCIICNTIMTAPVVNTMAKRAHPVIWVLHEWWTDDMIVENLALRSMDGMDLSTVKQALSCAAHVVCVCEAQRRLYAPIAPSSTIYVGVPVPVNNGKERVGSEPMPAPAYPPALTCSGDDDCNSNDIITFLTLGIVCPRKNQHWAVDQFKRFAGDRTDVRLVVVGARFTRTYERDYVEKVKEAIGTDARIELHDVTEEVDEFYARADVLLFTSLNEVTPLVISEAMSHRLPIISTDIAGIPEMVSHGSEGFLFSPGDGNACVGYMNDLADDADLRKNMGEKGKYTFDTMFDLNIMVSCYQQLIFDLAPATILIDMDGVLVDWDRGFYKAWAGRSHVDRSKSYHMEDCVPAMRRDEALNMMCEKDFFFGLPAAEGGIDALNGMVAAGFKVYLCTAPLLQSRYCAQEKVAWVREHLGEQWLPRLILANDKTTVRGDVLIDDKPMEKLSPGGRHSMATWKQIIFDAPYNQDGAGARKGVRMRHWGEWHGAVRDTLQQQVGAEGLVLGTNGNGNGNGMGMRRHDSRSNSTAALDQLMDDLGANLSANSISDDGVFIFLLRAYAPCRPNHQHCRLHAPLTPSTTAAPAAVARLTTFEEILREEVKQYNQSVDLASRMLAASSGCAHSLATFRPSYQLWQEVAKKGKGASPRRNVQPAHSTVVHGGKAADTDDVMEQVTQVVMDF